MSLPFDISEKLKSVQVRHYVEWLGRDSHCGYGFAFGYDEKSYRLIDELFQMLQDVETDDEDGAKELWLCARRGTIDDFAKQYGTYEENLEDGTVKNQKEYEDYWKSEFPDEVEWYRFVAVEHTDIKYRCVFLSNKQVLEMDKRLESGYTHDISEFTEWLVDAVKLTIEAVRNGTYNESVARLLPYKHRTGVITRAGLWKLYPEEKESFFEALTQEDVDEFLATGTEDCTGLPELKEMTANDFYRFCALGYAANNYDGQAFAPKAQYYPPMQQAVCHHRGDGRNTNPKLECQGYQRRYRLYSWRPVVPKREACRRVPEAAQGQKAPHHRKPRQGLGQEVQPRRLLRERE